MIPPHEYVECQCPLLYPHCAICFQVEENCRRRNAEETLRNYRAKLDRLNYCSEMRKKNDA